jgi:hypothetical protein
MQIERIITNIPAIIDVYVDLLTPFHSFNKTPHEFAIKIMKAMWSIQELAPFPKRLSPIP